MNKANVENWDGKDKFDPCSLYNWRLDWLEAKVKQHRDNGFIHSDEQYQRWWDEEERVYQNNKKDMTKVDKLQKNIGIIVPSHYYHVKWLKACLESCQKTGYYTLLAYDNPYYGKGLKHDTRLPTVETIMLADSVIMKHKTWGSGVGIPHAWNMLYGIKFLHSLGFEYIFNINGDCILEKPENFSKLTELLGGNDFIACEHIPEKKYCGTMSWLCKTEIALEIWESYINKLYTFNVGNAEARMGRHLSEGNYKVVEVENPEDAHFKPPGVKGTWRKLLGFRHLHAEHKVRRDLKLSPIDKKYLETGINNCFTNGHEQKTLLKYYETKDIKYLKAWWS